MKKSEVKKLIKECYEEMLLEKMSLSDEQLTAKEKYQYVANTDNNTIEYAYRDKGVDFDSAKKILLDRLYDKSKRLANDISINKLHIKNVSRFSEKDVKVK